MNKNQKNLMGVVPDFHLSEQLSYSEYIEGGRSEEETEVMNFMIDNFKDCDSIVFLGDIFDSRTPSANVIKKFVNFIEHFDDKKLYIIAGNHDQLYSGKKSSLDFLKEIKNKKWHIITDEITDIDGFTFMPYFSRQKLGVETDEEAVKMLMEELKTGKILFTHHAISKTETNSGTTDLFNEIVLPKEELEKKFKLIVGGHIHSPSVSKNVIVAGSVFTSHVGEVEKYIMKLDIETLKHDKFKLPCRPIYKLEDPIDKEIEELPENSIVKTIITKKMSAIEIGELKDKLRKFDALIFIEQIKGKRKKLHYTEGESLLEMSEDKLLAIYSKEKGISLAKLLHGFELIK